MSKKEILKTTFFIIFKNIAINMHNKIALIRIIMYRIMMKHIVKFLYLIIKT